MQLPPPILTDGVVTLRPLALADAQVHLAGEDEELVRWLNGGPGTPERVDAYVRRCMDGWAAGGPTFTFGIRVGADDLLAGTIEVRLEHEELVPDQAQLSYGLYPHARGRGFATRAVALACRFAATHPGITEVVIRVDAGNLPSAAVAVRTGFSYLGRRMEAREGAVDWYVRAPMHDDELIDEDRDAENCQTPNVRSVHADGRGAPLPPGGGVAGARVAR